MVQKIIKTDVFFVDKNIFKDNNEHYYDVECYNGYAKAHLKTKDDNAPQKLNIIYPKIEDVLLNDELCREILDYCGLWDLEKKDINYGDIMLYCGEINIENLN